MPDGSALSMCVATALRKFWDTENHSIEKPTLSIDEHNVMDHFVKTYHRDEQGNFIVLLPINKEHTHLGESRSSAVKRFLLLELALRSKG